MFGTVYPDWDGREPEYYPICGSQGRSASQGHLKTEKHIAKQIIREVILQVRNLMAEGKCARESFHEAITSLKIQTKDEEETRLLNQFWSDYNEQFWDQEDFRRSCAKDLGYYY